VKRSIGTRVALLNLQCVVLLAAGLAVLGWVVVTRTREPVLDGLRRVGVGAANELAAVADLYLASRREDVVVDALARTMAIDAVAYVRIVAADGAVLLERHGRWAADRDLTRLVPPPELLPLPRGQLVRVHDHDGVFHVARAVDLEGHALGSVVVGVGYGQLGDLAVMVGAILALVFLLAALRALQVSRKISAPLAEMARVARRVGGGDLEERVRCHTDDQETEVLKGAFNHMIAEVAGNRSVLEQKVEERTRHLARTMEDLRTARADLLQSTRLATVGETAGMAAHEILNPGTSMMNRLARMGRLLEGESTHNLVALRAVIDAWVVAWGTGGDTGRERLLQSLAAEIVTPDGRHADAASDDLRVLCEVSDYLEGLWEELRGDVRFCAREVQRIVRIVEDMRALARGHSRPEPVAVRDVVDEALEILHAKIAHHGVQVMTDLDATRCQVDRHEAVQVFTNLLSNAIHAVTAARPAGEGRIRVEGRTDADRLAVRVTDNGCGISPAVAERIFDFGFTTKPVGVGTGLGLGVALRLSRQHGGDLALEASTPGSGTTFRVTLPLADDTSAAALPAGPVPAAAAIATAIPSHAGALA
jgi:signal transduction histidine kinase